MERERAPAEDAARKRWAAMPPDPDNVLFDVREFADLARAGAYLAGDRRVTPKERSRWRLTFRQLSGDALAALRADDPAPAEEAVALIIGLACETRRFGYFRARESIGAAQVVGSDNAAAPLGAVPGRARVAPLRPTA